VTIKTACSQWGAVLGQVDDLRLTGNPSIVETTRFCTRVYNKRATLADFKAVFENPKCPAGSAFKFPENYDYLSKNTASIL
jgi:hypothetical protein